MNRTHSRWTARRWEEIGLCFGIFLAAINLWAVGSSFLSGPIFHPVLIIAGVCLVYVCGMLLAGATRDPSDMPDQRNYYADLP